MSRAYTMDVEVQGYNLDKQADIVEALQSCWDFRPVYYYAPTFGSPIILAATGDGNLTGGESEEEFAAKIAKAVWKVNGGYCCVTVGAACLAVLPYEEYVFEEAEFNSMTEEQYTELKKTDQQKEEN